MIRIAGAREPHPRATDAGREGARINSTAGHVSAAVGVVEDEGQFGAVKRVKPAIKDGTVPGKPIQVCRRAALRGLQLGLPHGRVADAR